MSRGRPVKYDTEEQRIAAIQAYRKDYYERNKHRLAEKRRERMQRPEVREKWNEYARIWQRNNSSNERVLLNNAKIRAERDNLNFNLDLEDIVIPEYCPVLPWIRLERHSHDTRPELDRKIPSLGYVKGNIQVISGRANRIKYNATAKELTYVLQNVLENESMSIKA